MIANIQRDVFYILHYYYIFLIMMLIADAFHLHNVLFCADRNDENL